MEINEKTLTDKMLGIVSTQLEKLGIKKTDEQKINDIISGEAKNIKDEYEKKITDFETKITELENSTKVIEDSENEKINELKTKISEIEEIHRTTIDAVNVKLTEATATIETLQTENNKLKADATNLKETGDPGLTGGQKDKITASLEADVAKIEKEFK